MGGTLRPPTQCQSIPACRPSYIVSARLDASILRTWNFTVVSEMNSRARMWQVASPKICSSGPFPFTADQHRLLVSP